MKQEKMRTLYFATILGFSFFNVEIVSAKLPKQFIKTFKTSKKEDAEDPYFQIKTMTIRKLTDEEVRELDNSSSDGPSQNKDFTGLIVPSAPTGQVSPLIPPIPPSPSIPPIPPVLGSPAVVDTGFGGSIIMIIDKLIAIGEKIIPTIKEGKSVITNNPMASVSVLPRSEAVDPVVHDMGGWSIPVSDHYQISYANGFGVEVISFVYSISYQYNGSVNGKGKYLAGIRASAREINISWGFDLDASSQLLQISNVGTQEDVIAGATFEMTYTVKNWRQTITNSVGFHVTGDGRLYKLD